VISKIAKKVDIKGFCCFLGFHQSGLFKIFQNTISGIDSFFILGLKNQLYWELEESNSSRVHSESRQLHVKSTSEQGSKFAVAMKSEKRPFAHEKIRKTLWPAFATT